MVGILLAWRVGSWMVGKWHRPASDALSAKGPVTAETA